VIGERWAFDFFRRVEDAESYLEPWYVDEEYIGFDAEGRGLRVRPATRRVRQLFGLLRFDIETVSVEAEPGEARPNDLRSLLLEYLRHLDADVTGLNEAPVSDLFERCVELGEWTNSSRTSR